jgi:hypothetical protein
MDSPSSHLVEHLERNLMNMHQVQGHQLNDIESHVSHGNSFVCSDTVELGGRALAPKE